MKNVIWVLFDISNGDYPAKNYLWWFYTREAARKHKRAQKKRKNSAALIGPFKYKKESPVFGGGCDNICQKGFPFIPSSFLINFDLFKDGNFRYTRWFRFVPDIVGSLREYERFDFCI